MSNSAKTDEWLKQAFSQPALADDGFSKAVMRRVRRRAWLRRWTMPIATVIATAVAARPAIDLLLFVNSLFGVAIAKVELLSVPTDWFMHSATGMVTVAMIVFAGIFMNALQD